jgi:hypothetical protein
MKIIKLRKSTIRKQKADVMPLKPGYQKCEKCGTIRNVKAVGYCIICQENRIKDYYKEQQKRWMQPGICTSCKKENKDQRYKTCIKCRNYAKKQYNER